MTVPDESRFETEALRLLERWLGAIEDGDRFEAEFESGILTVKSASGGTWVLNKHAPMRQLWLSSPVSGGSHYALDGASGEWRDTRGGPPLALRLGAELSAAAGLPIVLA